MERFKNAPRAEPIRSLEEARDYALAMIARHGSVQFFEPDDQSGLLTGTVAGFELYVRFNGPDKAAVRTRIEERLAGYCRYVSEDAFLIRRPIGPGETPVLERIKQLLSDEQGPSA